MARLNLLLLMAVIATSLYLVHTQYRSRQLYTELAPYLDGLGNAFAIWDRKRGEA